MTPLTKHYLETLAEKNGTTDERRHEVLDSDLDSAWRRMTGAERDFCNREVAAMVRNAASN